MDKNGLESPRLALHLADRALAPLFSSADFDTPRVPGLQSQTQAQALSSLTNTAIIAHDTSLRLGLGAPMRIMVEMQSSGPIVLQSFLNPSSINNSESDKNSRSLIEIDEEPQKSIDSCLGKGTTDRGSNGSKMCVPDISIANDKDVHGELGDKKPISPSPPLLIAVVVAPTSVEAAEARRAASRLVRAGRECQGAWLRGRMEIDSESSLLGDKRYK
ncbi:BgtA-21434 [Blumeria graminis f. sp. tritici]|uniref:BgtA-21434 n=2 Tax=Blumeria graminis f. sp. tritici TaxID=62690 RepID=A0A9X9PR32_BLUGR|nr:hypothetical protein BGT96224_A21434 [Blumeria graminis f. sp. tritici 96224]VCU39612.1 BgtA-21434 [Blumeria graminis f. sp. tritici]